MTNAIPSVKISGHIHVTLESGGDLSINIGDQRAIDVAKLSDQDLDFLEDLLRMLAEQAKLLRKKYEALG